MAEQLARRAAIDRRCDEVIVTLSACIFCLYCFDIVGRASSLGPVKIERSSNLACAFLTELDYACSSQLLIAADLQGGI